MNDIAIRPARLPEEAETLKGFVMDLQAYEHAFEANRRLDAGVDEDYFAQLMALVAARDGRIWVAENAEGLAGWLVALVNEDDVYVQAAERRYGMIEELFVREGARGAGVGRALVAAAEADIRARGLTVMMIGVLPGNAAASAAYEALGFATYYRILRKRI